MVVVVNYEWMMKKMMKMKMKMIKLMIWVFEKNEMD